MLAFVVLGWIVRLGVVGLVGEKGGRRACRWCGEMAALEAGSLWSAVFSADEWAIWFDYGLLEVQACFTDREKKP